MPGTDDARQRERLAGHPDDVTLERIAEAAGVGVGTIYRRFRTVDELLSVVLEEKMIRYADEAERAAEQSKSEAWEASSSFVMFMLEQQASDLAFSDVTLAPARGSELPHAAAVTRITFGPGEWLEITIDPVSGTLTLDRDHASSDPRAHRGVLQVANAFDPDRKAEAAQVFVDGSIVEVFTSAGRVLTTRIYPTAPPPWSIDAPPRSTLYRLSSRGAVGEVGVAVPKTEAVRV